MVPPVGDLWSDWEGCPAVPVLDSIVPTPFSASSSISSSSTGIPSIILTRLPSRKTTMPAIMPVIAPSEIRKPVTHPGRVNRFSPHMAPDRAPWIMVFQIYIHTTRSMSQGFDGDARFPVSGGCGMLVAGNGTAWFCSSSAILSSGHSGGESAVFGLFLVYFGGGSRCTSSSWDPARRYQPRL